MELDDTTSGFLIEKDDQAVIGVNIDHHPNRQRFTIAHEIGHACMHTDVSKNFIDSSTIVVKKRDSKSSEGIKEEEIEANAFAAELLMPQDALIDYLDQNAFDIHNDIELLRMSEYFGVSMQALSIRLSRLGLAQ